MYGAYEMHISVHGTKTKILSLLVLRLILLLTLRLLVLRLTLVYTEYIAYAHRDEYVYCMSLRVSLLLGRRSVDGSILHITSLQQCVDAPRTHSASLTVKSPRLPDPSPPPIFLPLYRLPFYTTPFHYPSSSRPPLLSPETRHQPQRPARMQGC